MHISKCFRAELSKFVYVKPVMFFNDSLKAVNTLRKSIARFGLFSPILVVKKGEKLVVVDGRKRLDALKRLHFAGLLPDRLAKIPYVIVTDAKQEDVQAYNDMLPLLSNRQKFETFTAAVAEGYDIAGAARFMNISDAAAQRLASLKNLSPTLSLAYFNDILSFSQAQAFATLPNHAGQDRLLKLLGPQVQAPEIVLAIETGKTVIGIGDGCDEDNIIIMPSRPREMPRAA